MATKRARGGAKKRTARKLPAKNRPANKLPKWTPERVEDLLARLKRMYPEAGCSLDHARPLELLVATILSAQCTDERVNKVTPGLFARYPGPADYAAAPRAELESAIKSTGFFRAKARSIQECCRDIVERHGGEVPRTLEQLTALRGVGRKTANVVLGNAFGIPGITVDTHFARLSQRFGWTTEADPVKIESEVGALFPRTEWTMLSHRVIWHGRRVCHSRRPACGACEVARLCPSYGIGPVDPEVARALVKQGPFS